jgi:hypothetical protein
MPCLRACSFGGMWRPRSFSEVALGIGVLSEDSHLDFKKQMPPKHKLADFAKDAAAMSVEGGVIVIGVDEQAGTASKVTKIPLAGAPEQLQQVIDSRVQPPVAVEIESLRQHPGDAEGVVVVAIPPSLFCPHQVDGRYPARSGAVTRLLSEPEIERLYAQRRNSLDAEGMSGMADFVRPPNSETAVRGGIGRLRLFVRPLVQIDHPAYPRLRTPLNEATAAADRTLQSLIAPAFRPATLDWLLARWRPRGSTGWAAGEISNDFARMKDNRFAAATYIYGSGISFETSLSLIFGDQDQHRCAYEHLWAAEVMAMLAIAGAFFVGFGAPIGLQRVDMTLEGVDRVVSFASSRGQHWNQQLPQASEGRYGAGGLFNTSDLSREPQHAARELFERWWASFLDDRDDPIGRLATRP